jgi:hypothetical protein
MLGFKEKRQYQGIVNNGLDFLATSPSFSEKRKTQKDISNALEKLGESAPATDTNIVFLQEVIAGKHDSENVNDLAQKVIDSSEIVVATDDLLVASAIDKFVSLDLSVFG